MKIKVWNKQTSKWFNGEKDITWACKRGEDWWLVKPPKNSDEPPKEKESQESRFTLRDFFMSVLIGGGFGMGVSACFYIWLLIKNA